jgi:cytochrome o ubiquinol oxidase operon protein cyoD
VSGINDRKPGKLRSAAVYGLTLALAGLVLASTYWASRSADPVSGPSESKQDEIRSYAIGYGLALALTGAAFATVHWPSFVSATTLAIVLGLALVQLVVHFRFFLHISLGKSARDDLQLILFSTLIVILMVSGTLIILFNLRARMM